ncbi:NADH-quinone oxidoreductase subunit I [Candidatus Bathyarchaeota archaeon]|nr:NADH-quinone oxidoreductase subunit I [Candidatus Bathyarchaeota archaeon]
MPKKRRLPALIKDMGLCIFKRPVTREYPSSKVEVPEGYRGRQSLDPEKCISCGLCARDCPAQAIELIEVSGKRMPHFYLDRCIFCYLCAEGCPREAIKLTTNFEMSTTEKDELMVQPEEFISKPKQVDEGKYNVV